jgi:hypothetical protein
MFVGADGDEIGRVPHYGTDLVTQMELIERRFERKAV